MVPTEVVSSQLNRPSPQAWLTAWVAQWLALGLAVLLLGVQAHAAPRIALDKQPESLDLRKVWESALVDAPGRANAQSFDPQEVWQWPAERFSSRQADQRIVLAAQQRLVARFELVSSQAGDHVYVVFKMPRLDAVQVFYRYGSEPWKMESAGDTLPMTTWPFFDRQPTFDLPHKEGNLSVVIVMAHGGVVDAPVVLENSNSFRQGGINSAITAGLLIGVNLVLAAVGFMAALNFRRFGFLSISLMTLLTSLVVFTNSGLAGMYVLTQSSEFNDQSKFLANTLLCVALPWVAAVALSQRFYSRGWWYVAMAWAALGTLAAVWLMQYPLRHLTSTLVPFVLATSVLTVLAMLANALLRAQTLAVSAAPGIVLYAVALFAPFAAYLGVIENDLAVLAASVAISIAALVFLQVMVKRHRQGRMVMARAKTSVGRDVLTGLLNRQGFEQVLAKNVQRMHAEKVYAAFFYVTVSDAQTLQERFGDEGFEGGMVQMAAAISSSVSVVDTVGRVASNAFAVTVLMPRDAKLANSMGQKMITRTMSLASHGSPMAQTARIAIAWLPVFGTLLPDIERRALRTLHKMEGGKRIAWVGGEYAQMNLSQIPDGTSSPTTKPNNGQTADDDLPSLPGMINRIEEEMLGPDTQQLKAEADRLMKMMQAHAEQPDFANTKVEAREPVRRK